MKAAIFDQFACPLTIRSVPDPVPSPDGAVIRVKANGICRSDWHGWQGHDPDVALPHVPGHELAGVVEAVGSRVKRWRRGDRVTVPFSGGCGDCTQCQSGNHQICDRYFQPGFTSWGSFAEFVAIRYADVNLVSLPGDVDWITGASLGCRFATAFRAVIDQGRLAADEWLAVHGCGGVGLSAVMIGTALGARVIGVDIDAEKLALAETIGATHVLNAEQEKDIPGMIRAITGSGAALSIDALGSSKTCRDSVLCLAKRGRHVQVGVMVTENREPAIPMGLVMFRELEVLGSHGIQAHRYKELLEMIRVGKLEPRRLVNKTIPLEQAPAELEAMGGFRSLGITVIDRF